jgi:RimJ/RimL family protein N-acetyltransferase
VLRHFVPDDAPSVMRLNSEETTRKWLPSHVYADLTQAAVSLGYLIQCYSSPGDARLGPYVLGVEHRETRQLLGHVGFSPLGRDVEVSYAIAEGARGQGYGTEALAGACVWAARSFVLHRLIAITAAANRLSRRTLERAGFFHAGNGTMRFQGSEQSVSRYVWLPSALDESAA